MPTVLRHKVVAYVPIVGDDYSYAHNIARELCTLYGGCTTIEAKGYWNNPEGECIADSLLMLTCWTDTEMMQRNYPAFITLMERIKSDLGQSSVAFEADNQLWLF
jgi:hypothetical protein